MNWTRHRWGATLTVLTFLLPPTLVFAGEESCTAFRVRQGEAVPLVKSEPSYLLGKLGDHLLRNPVKVQFAYDAENLYFRFHASDDDLVDEFPDNKTSGMYLFSDTVELFVKTEKSRGYLEFHFIPTGKCGMIFFPSRGRRMPSNVKYLEFEPEYKVKVSGTINNYSDKDNYYEGTATIPFSIIEKYCKEKVTAENLRIQVTSVSYSVYADGDEKAQLNYESGTWTDPHYLPSWCKLKLLPNK